jgi:hypothetical protein
MKNGGITHHTTQKYLRTPTINIQAENRASKNPVFGVPSRTHKKVSGTLLKFVNLEEAI